MFGDQEDSALETCLIGTVHEILCDSSRFSTTMMQYLNPLTPNDL
jgi:hypothetical protein